MDYLNANEEVLKSMKKIYGNKILSKVFKAQKEKFFENVMLDHTFKKNKINEFVALVNQYEKTISDFQDTKDIILNKYNDYCDDLQVLRELIEKKRGEQQALKDAKIELMENIENMLMTEIEEITTEKIKLRQKLNCDFYFVKVKELAKKIETLRTEKEGVLKEFFHFRDVIIEREQKLYKDEMEMKKELMNLNSEEVNADLLGNVTEKMKNDEIVISESNFPYKVDSNRLNDYCDDGVEEQKDKEIEEQLDVEVDNDKFEQNDEQQVVDKIPIYYETSKYFYT